jgi:hypothetical protein
MVPEGYEREQRCCLNNATSILLALPRRPIESAHRLIQRLNAAPQHHD